MATRNSSNLPSSPIPQEVKEIASAIATGKVTNAKMEWRNGEIHFMADNADGTARFILEKQEFGGVRSETRIGVPRPENREQRLERVLELRKRGMTQQKISQFTMTSQRTVSSDIQELKRRGCLDK
jgi:Fic family protein